MLTDTQAVDRFLSGELLGQQRMVGVQRGGGTWKKRSPEDLRLLLTNFAAINTSLAEFAQCSCFVRQLNSLIPSADEEACPDHQTQITVCFQLLRTRIEQL